MADDSSSVAASDASPSRLAGKRPREDEGDSGSAAGSDGSGSEGDEYDEDLIAAQAFQVDTDFTSEELQVCALRRSAAATPGVNAPHCAMYRCAAHAVACMKAERRMRIVLRWPPSAGVVDQGVCSCEV